MPSETQAIPELDAAIACHEAGQLDDAEALYRAVLHRDPDELDALNLLGLLLQDRGKLEESIDLLAKAVALDPDFPEALTNLARAQSASGATEAAAANAERAARLDPCLVEAHLQHGRALLALGRNEAALQACRAAATLAPDAAEVQSNLGLALARNDDLDGAVAAFDAALRLQPDFAPALNGLAIAHLRLRQVESGLRCAQRAVDLAPREPEYRLGLAYALRENRKVRESLAVCRDIAASPPLRAEAWVLQGDNLSMLGDFQEAADSFHRALKIDPAAIDAIAGLARIARLEADAVPAAALKEAVLDPAQPIQQRITAGFTLGSALDRVGRHDEAFVAYTVANRLVRERSHDKDPAAELPALHRRVNKLIETFDASLFRDFAGCDESELPVFVVGMPRSGTTLVEQIAASHSQVFAAGERKDIPEISLRLEGDPPVIAPREWERAAMLREAREYVAQLRGMAGGRARVVDKLPDNVLLLGHIALLLPRARVVICRRDPRDIGLSCFFQSFRDAPWSADLADCATRICEIERLLYHWRDVLPLRMLEVQYEQLVADPEAQCRRLIEFLGLEWDPSCLSPHRTDRVVMTASSWQVRQPIYQSSIGRWRHYRTHVGALLDGLAGIAENDGNADVGGPCDDARQILQAALQHRKEGRPAAAEAALRRILVLHPDMPEALHQLSAVLYARGSADAAIALLERAVALKPDDADFVTDLAVLHCTRPELAEMAKEAEAVCRTTKNSVAAHLRLGILQLGLKQNDAAAKTLSIGVTLAPSSFHAQLHLGTALMRTGKYYLSVEALEAARAIQPDNVNCLCKLGAVLRTLDRDQDALRIHEHAAEIAPDDPRALQGLAFARWQAHQPAEALELCRRTLEIVPDDPVILLVQGYCQAALGRFREAEASFRRTLEIAPTCEDARLGLAELRQDVGDAAEADRLHAVLANESKTATERIGAGFALGLILEKAGEYEQAFAAFAAANHVAKADRGRPAVRYDATGFMRAFTRDAVLEASRWGDPSDLPVFIVGMPRSGTTLVEQILGSHPTVHPGGERKEMRGIALNLGQGEILAPPGRWDPLVIRKEASWHVARLQELAPAATRVIDKMPDNLQFLGHISVLFPGARVIICRRDLRDVCLSCFFRRFSDPSLDWANDLTDLAQRACAITDLTRYWQKTLPLRMTEVRYEHLVMNIEAESRRLIDFLGLEWDPACLNFHETERVVMTASQWQVRQPLYTSSVGRWKLYEKHLQPLFDGLRGYLPEDEPVTRA